MIKLCYGDYISDATSIELVSPTAVASTLPASNLKTTIRTQVCRFTSNEKKITFSIPESSVSVIALVLPSSNISFTWQFELRDAYGVLASTISSGITFSSNTYFSNVAYENVTSVTIQINCGNAYFDLSHIFVGDCFEPEGGIEYGLSLTYKDLSATERAEDGSLLVTAKETYRQLEITFPLLNPTERQKLSAILAYLGNQNPCFVSLFTADTLAKKDYEMLGYVSGDSTITAVSPNRFNNKLVIVEA